MAAYEGSKTEHMKPLELGPLPNARNFTSVEL